MSEVIRFEVVGLPAPQGSKTRMPNGAMVDGNSAVARGNLAAWREAVRHAARRHLADHPCSPLDQPAALEVVFRFPPTASDPYRHYHAVKPDVDKLLRSTLDALVQGGILRDDARVCRVEVTKLYADEYEPIGAHLAIRPLGAEEAGIRAARKQAVKARRAEVVAS